MRIEKNPAIDAVLKEIMQVAAQLPRMEYVVKEKTYLTGEEAKLTGFSEDAEDGKVYEITSPAYYEWNHYRRMKRIYKSNLSRGHEHAYQLVKDYITAVIAVNKQQEVAS